MTGRPKMSSDAANPAMTSRKDSSKHPTNVMALTAEGEIIGGN